MEENELRKKQEQAMREKQLAEEAKQHDPKVQLLLQPFTSKVLRAGEEAYVEIFPLPSCRSRRRRRGSSSTS